MWFIFIAACLFIGGLLIPGSRDPQYGHRDALVNSLIRAAGLTPAWRQLRWRTRPQAQRPRSAARHLHGGWKGGGGSRCRDARSGSLQRMVRRCGYSVKTPNQAV